MHIEITPMTMLEYMLCFAGERSALSDQYVVESEKYNLLFSARADGAYAGYLCLIPDADTLRIAYVFTAEPYRRQGVCTAMIRFVIDRVRIPVRISIVTSFACRDAIAAVSKKLGFEQIESVEVFTCKRENYPAWLQFMEQKGNRLCAFLEHRGYEAVRFADADEDLLRQIKESTRSEYANTLDPAPFLEIPEKKMSWTMSWAARKDGQLAAYTLVTQISPAKVIFEHISDSKKERGTGCILLPFARAMETFGTSSNEMVSYAMYGSNDHANAFRKKLLNVLNSDSITSENYLYKPR